MKASEQLRGFSSLLIGNRFRTTALKPAYEPIICFSSLLRSLSMKVRHSPYEFSVATPAEFVPTA